MEDDFESARDLYSEAIKLDNKNINHWLDRAQVHLLMSNFAAAELDADMSIALDTSCAKAFFHKGAACMGLKKYSNAKAALQAAASLAKEGPLSSECFKMIEDMIEVPQLGDVFLVPGRVITEATQGPQNFTGSSDKLLELCVPLNEKAYIISVQEGEDINDKIYAKLQALQKTIVFLAGYGNVEVEGGGPGLRIVSVQGLMYFKEARKAFAMMVSDPGGKNLLLSVHQRVRAGRGGARLLVLSFDQMVRGTVDKVPAADWTRFFSYRRLAIGGESSSF